MIFTFFMVLLSELTMVTLWTLDLVTDRVPDYLILLTMVCFGSAWTAILMTTYHSKHYKCNECKSVSLRILLKTLLISLPSATLILFALKGNFDQDLGDPFLIALPFVLGLMSSIFVIFPFLLFWYPIKWRRIRKYEAQALENKIFYPALPYPRALIAITSTVGILSVLVDIYIII